MAFDVEKALQADNRSTDRGIPDCYCQPVLVLGAGRLMSYRDHGPLARFLNLSFERA